MRATVIALAVVLAASRGAYAQDSPDAQAAPAPQQGDPLVLEPVRSPFVVAPEYKMTEVDGRTGQLAGAYAGRLLDEQLLVAGALYTLTNLSRGTDLTYGGLLVGWMTAPGHRVRFGARSLVGFGEGEIPVVVSAYAPRPFDPRSLVRFGGGPAPQPQPAFAQPGTISVRVRDNFAVVEPEANVSARLTDHMAVEFSAGYRLTGFTEALRDRLNGVTGALALQFGW